MTTKSLYQVKRDQTEKKEKKRSNTITDADYFLRDKAAEAKRGNPNTSNMTPAAPPEVKKGKAKED